MYNTVSSNTNSNISIPTNKAAGIIFKHKDGMGKLLWSFNIGGEITAAPYVANGIVYIGSSGTLSPYVVNGTGYLVGNTGNSLYALDAKKGELLWTFIPDGYNITSAYVQDNIMYVGSESGTVYAYSGIESVEKVIEEIKEALEDSEVEEEAPKIKFGNGWIIIGNTRVPVRKAEN